MYQILIFFIIGLVAAMLFLNLYFRMKVLKVYRKMVDARVEFQVQHIFNAKKMEEEVYPKYPNSEADIREFVRYLRYSIKMATVLITLITLFGAVLMYYRHD